VVVLGIDFHQGTHTAVAVDEEGRALGVKTVRATDAGHRQLLGWARSGWPRARFAVAAGHLSTRLAQALLAAGHPVVRLPSITPSRSKRDPTGALAIARQALRHDRGATE